VIGLSGILNQVQHDKFVEVVCGVLVCSFRCWDDKIVGKWNKGKGISEA